MSAQIPVNVKLTAVLTDNTGVALQGATVLFTYKLSSATAFTSGGSAVTDSTGTTSVTLPLMAPDTYDFDAKFNGTSAFAASAVEIVFDTTARLPQSQLTVQVTPVTPSSANVSGTLSSSGSPISAATVSVAVDGAGVGSATTDASGVYAFQVQNLGPGAHTIAVSFAGNSSYAPSQASSSFGGVSGGSTGRLAAAAAITILAVAAAFAFVTRKKK